jgi:hypothetical protein
MQLLVQREAAFSIITLSHYHIIKLAKFGPCLLIKNGF